MTTMTTTMTTASGTRSDAKVARTRRLLEGAIVPTLLKLAAPNILNLVALTVIATADAFFVGWLGASALAGVATFDDITILEGLMTYPRLARVVGAGRPASRCSARC